MCWFGISFPLLEIRGSAYGVEQNSCVLLKVAWESFVSLWWAFPSSCPESSCQTQAFYSNYSPRRRSVLFYWSSWTERECRSWVWRAGSSRRNAPAVACLLPRWERIRRSEQWAGILLSKKQSRSHHTQGQQTFHFTHQQNMFNSKVRLPVFL